MNAQRIRWRAARGDIEPLLEWLHPVRTHEEVAAILGTSASLVRALESSALRKVARAMIRLEGEFDPEASDED